MNTLFNPQTVTVPELASWITTQGDDAVRLRAEADRIRHETVGDEVHLRAIIEFSSYCCQHCEYCGLRAENEHLERYRLTPDELVETAVIADELGFGTVVLQSGEDIWWTAERMAEVIRQIKDTTDLAITLSLGEREEWEYRLWFEAGADRYLLKHETASVDLYRTLHPQMSWEHRINCLKILQNIGYQIGSGCIVGLPGQTPEILAQDLLLMRDISVHMAGIGPIIPHPDTPLAHLPSGDPQIVLNMMALLRILVPDVMLATTTALETIIPGGRAAGLQVGGNVIMPNVTPREFAKLYEIYPGKKAPRIAVMEEIERVHEVVANAGRIIGKGPGHSPRLAAKSESVA